MLVCYYDDVEFEDVEFEYQIHYCMNRWWKKDESTDTIIQQPSTSNMDQLLSCPFSNEFLKQRISLCLQSAVPVENIING